MSYVGPFRSDELKAGENPVTQPEVEDCKGEDEGDDAIA
jgi:hypothetical protein